MEQIAAGQGQGAEAVHAGERRQAPSRRGLAFQPRRRRGGARQGSDGVARTGAGSRASRGEGRSKVAAMPDFVAPQLCALGRPAAERATAGATRSSSTATACSCASRTARPCSIPARGWTGPTNSAPSPRRRERLPDCIDRRRDRRARRQRRAGFLGAAGGDVRRQDRGPDLLRLRSAVRRWRGSSPPAARASARRV